MKRFIAYLALALLLPMAAIAQDEQPGFFERLIEDNLSGPGRAVRVTGFQGALSSRATLEELTIADDAGVWLTLRGVTLDWSRAALLSGRLEVNALTADALLLPRRPVAQTGVAVPAPEASGFALPELPVSIAIGQLAIGRAELGEPLFGAAAVVSLDGSLSLAGGTGAALLSVDRIDGRAGTLSLDAAYTNATGDLKLNLALSEAADGIAANLIGLPGRPSVALDIQGTGTLADFSADIALATDGSDRLTGVVTLTAQASADAADTGPAHRFTAALGGDIAPVFSPEFRPFFGPDIRLNVDGSRSPDGRVILDAFRLAARSVALQGALVLAADGLPETLSVSGSIADASGAAVLLPFGSAPIRIDRADIDVLFDASLGDQWSGTVGLAGLATTGIAAERLTLTGTGQIRRDPVTGNNVTADLDFDGVGLRLGDAKVTAALGTALTGKAALNWRTNAPLDIANFELVGSGYQMSGAGQLDTQDRDLAVSGQVTASIVDLAPFSALAGRDLGGGADASVSGSGALLGGNFAVDLSATGRDLRLGEARLDRFLAGASRLTLKAARDASGLRIETLDLKADALAATLSGALQTAGSDLRLSARLADAAMVVPTLTGPLSLQATAQQETAGWQVDVTATGPGQSAISVTGLVLDPLGAPAFDGAASAEASDLSVFSGLAGRALAGRLALDIRHARTAAFVNGIDDLLTGDFAVDLSASGRDLRLGEARLDPFLQGQSALTLKAVRDGSGLAVEILDLKTDALAATLAGLLHGANSDLRLSARLADAAMVVPTLTGPLSLQATAQQETAGWQVDVTATGPGQSAISVTGLVLDPLGAPAFDGAASAEASDLSVFSALAGRALGGRLALDIRHARTAAFVNGIDDLLTGDFAVDLSATGRDLRLGEARLDPFLNGQSALTLKAVRDGSGLAVEILDLKTDALAATLAGLLHGANSDLRLTATLSDSSVIAPDLSGPLSLRATARQTGRAWQIDADATGPGQSDISIAGTLTDPLTAPAFDGRASAAVANLAPFSGLAGRRLGGRAQVDLNGRASLGDKSFQLNLVADATDLALGQRDADTLLAGQSHLEAVLIGADGAYGFERLRFASPQLTASGDGTFETDLTALEFDLRLADLGLFAEGISGPLSIQGTASQPRGADWRLALDATGPAGSQATVAGSLAGNFATANIGVTGRAPAGLANRFITPNSVAGTLDFDLRLDGRPALASVSGTISTSGTRVVVPAPGVVLNDVGATATLQNGQARLTVGASVQGGGRVSLDGPVNLQAPYLADLAARLIGVKVSDNVLYDTSVDGALTIVGPLAGGAALAGTVTLGRTELQIPSTGLGATGEIPDLVHLNEPAAVHATRARAGLLDTGGPAAARAGPAYPLDIRLVASNQVFVRGRGLDAELGGQLRITGTTADIVPSGQFTLLRGRLDILGKRLVLDEGGAQLQGAFVPVIRLVASTESDGVRVIITIEGPASDPVIRFSSQPELPEDEVLARLLFGRGISQISPLQAAQLVSAVSTLAGRGGVGIIGRLRQSFGLDDLDVTTDAAGNTAVRAGRYLSENIYTDVTIGNQKTEINLNLDISRTVTAKGKLSSTGETSLGIFFERDY